nr:glycosyltransferase family 2 protein [Helicobacter macacae]
MYNVETYLKECLDSIQAQTYENFIAIMVDDCSTDSSAKIAGQYAKNDKRFILVKKQVNEGLGMARNTGLDYLFNTLKPNNSDYIGFVDSDDVIALDYFANLIYCLESHAKQGIMVAKSFNVYRFKHEDYKSDIFAYRRWKSRGGITRKGSKIEACRALYRAKFLKILRYPPVRLCEDITFGNIVNALADKVAYTRTARYFYRQRAGSLMKNYAYHYDEQFANFAYMLEHFVKFDLLRRHKIDISLVQNMPEGAEDKHFAKLKNLIASYNFDEDILRFNPRLKAILECRDYKEFCAKIDRLKPISQRVKHYFRIDIRASRIYIKLFGKVLCDKRFR